MGLFLLSILMIPSISSFLAPPKEKHIQHLDNKTIRRIIDQLVELTYHHIKWVYFSAFLVLLVGLYGITLIKSSGYMVDDIPESDVIYKDLKFFEKHVDGIMPLEIIVDTKKPNGAMNLQTFKLIDKLENRLEAYDELSPSLSLLNILKFAKQAFYNGKEKYYTIPNNNERNS